ncbi:MAG TPA: hypothetical protein GXZ20_07020 [Halanaerobiaceae bacterium]|jgi:stage III sporulation protein AB|nr:stage III sporulation protein AB [Bacillota bacterium]HHU92874.1 hypothetical protein [Halanaerobiaceae bacterium]HOA41316.1 stage III sporulation protein AB [Halanaerobiales bacterium]HPZ63496.1 stage III sporulation protein AB [Halanaerobiales bacterium]HQD03963.1 stage III sporulation protein AB [Halanaerobiales bacterium]
MVKFCGACLILVSGTSIGWIIASVYLNRERELKELQLAFSILNTEISYGKNLLADVLESTARVLRPPLAYIFSRTGEELANSREKGFADLWQENIAKYGKESFLLEEDLEILINWGRQIGTSSLDDQVKVNQLALKRLEQQEEEAREIARQRVKPIRYAGVLLSLMLIILFY